MTPGKVLVSVASALVETSRRHAAAVTVGLLALVAALGWYAAGHISINSDTQNLMSPDLDWRRADAEIDRSFPQNKDVLAIVIDGDTPDEAEDAAAALLEALRAQPALLRDVRDPQGSDFFRREGLLYLSKDEVQKTADQMIAAQPMLGTLAADPSARGVFGALDLFAQGAIQGEVPLAQLDRPFQAVAAAVNDSVVRRHRPLSWQNLLSERKPLPRELRRFILAQPVSDYASVEPGKRAIDAIHVAAASLGLVPSRGVTVRVTGPPALSDDQFAALKEGAGLTAAVSLGLLLFWLILSVRSLRSAGAIFLTLVCGLLACVAFAVAVVGPFDPISIAFAPLFVGIAVDFGIQFSVRYSAERHRWGLTPEAFRHCVAGVGTPLMVAGAATAVGFFSLSPTDYRGVAHLGLIAGAGMIIALTLNLTLLPALLALLRPRGFYEASGFSWGAKADRWFERRRSWVFALAALAVVASAIALTRLRFDFDPIDLENPRAESVQTLFDLMRSPDTTPYTLDVLTPSQGAAADASARIGALPEVSQTIWLGSFIPEDQKAKLDILSDAQGLLGPTLSPPSVKPAPSPPEVLEAASRCAADLDRAAKAHGGAAADLAAALRRLVAAGPSVLPALNANLVEGVRRRIDDMRLVLQAKPVTLESIAPDVRRDWVSADGRYRVQVFPKGDGRDARILRRFVDAVRRVAPGAAGMPIDIEESGRLVLHAFAVAGILAFAAIFALLAAVLSSLRAVAAVLIPLALAGLLTGATAAAAGVAINFANIVTLPLLLAIGVAFDIYFVVRWRGGEVGLLRSPTARGIVFSALATGTAFGSLTFSNSPGMADMGKLLSIGLFYTLVCTLFFVPVFLGRPGGNADKPQ
jgi:hopanoid biosynthesis associated RND transporter like protein HpnN